MLLVDLHRGHEWCAFLHTDPVCPDRVPIPPDGVLSADGRPASAPAATGVASHTAGREHLSRSYGDQLMLTCAGSQENRDKGQAQRQDVPPR
ncbi:hypothetical protein T261_5203 [Streptomyces lydicus]|nr:hypothetical protein T261_5203 [Streptomyces lydicus]